MGALQTGQSFLFWIHLKRHLQWKRCPQVLSLRQFSSSVMQITQFCSGALLEGGRALSKALSRRVWDLYLLRAEVREVRERKQALRREAAHRQLRKPSLSRKALRKRRMRLQQCHTRSELPTTSYTASSLQEEGSAFTFWLKQLSISPSEARLEQSRKTQSTASMRVGKSSRLVSLTATPSNSTCTLRKQRRLSRKTRTARALEADSTAMSLLLQEQSPSIMSRSILITKMALRMRPTPTYDTTHTARSNMFHRTSPRISTTIDRWQKYEYSSVLGLRSPLSRIWKYTHSTRWISPRSPTSPNPSHTTAHTVTSGYCCSHLHPRLSASPHIIPIYYIQPILPNPLQLKYPY